MCHETVSEIQTVFPLVTGPVAVL